MTNATDFLLDADGDLLLSKSGDFVVGNSDGQHVQHILLAYPGFYRTSPLTGVGIRSYQKGVGVQLLLQRKIRIQMEADNYLIQNVTVANSTPLRVTVDVDRIR